MAIRIDATRVTREVLLPGALDAADLYLRDIEGLQ